MQGGVTMLILNFDDKALEVNISTQDGPATGTREEYHLTSPNSEKTSQVMLLNGQVLSLTSSNDIPQMKPQKVDSGKPIEVAPLSIVFVRIPGVSAPACVV